jgi:hypothetical protein
MTMRVVRWVLLGIAVVIVAALAVAYLGFLAPSGDIDEYKDLFIDGRSFAADRS